MSGVGQENLCISFGYDKGKPVNCQLRNVSDEPSSSMISSIIESFYKLDTQSSDEMQAEVKKIVRDLFTRRAVSLKAEIQEEMDAIEKDLEGFLRRVQIINESIKKSDEKLAEVKAQKNKIGEEDLEMNKTRLLEIKQRILDETTQRENRMQELLNSWDYFRTGFKDKILEAIQAEIKKMDEADDKWDPNNPLSWAYYLPDVMKKMNIDYSTAAPYFP